MNINFKKHWGYFLLTFLFLIALVLNAIYIPRALKATHNNTEVETSVQIKFYKDSDLSPINLAGIFNVYDKNAGTLFTLLTNKTFSEAGIKFNSSKFGHFLVTAFGITPDINTEFWSIRSETNTNCKTNPQHSCMVGVDDLKITNHDQYEIVLTHV